MLEKTILIIAGPNGAGKTTLATELLLNEVNCPTFVNADLIAAGLNPLQPEREAIAAGRMMLNMIRTYVGRGQSFAVETTLSGRTYAGLIPRWQEQGGPALGLTATPWLIPRWQEQGYRVRLFFLSLPTPEVAIERVSKRAQTGGHSIPEEVIRRRFYAGRRNFDTIYRELVDQWMLCDNTGDAPVLIDEGRETMTEPNTENQKPEPEPRPYDPYREGALDALRRAAKKARRRDIALTGSTVSYRDGKIVYDTEP